MSEEFRFKPGHFKILVALAREDGLRKEDLAKAVGDRTLAVGYRKDLLRLGLICQDEEDRFHLTARSWRLLYAYQVLRLFEEAVKKTKGTLHVLETGDIRVFGEGAPHAIGFTLRMGELSESLEEVVEGGLSEDDRLLYAMAMALINIELNRAAGLLRETIIEARRRIVLLTFPKDKRELISRYRGTLLAFLKLCNRILFTRHPRYAEENKRFIEEMDELGEVIRKRLEDPKTRRIYAFFLERLGKPPKRLGRKMFEELVAARTSLIEEELIRDRGSLLWEVESFFKECRGMAGKRERDELNKLYRKLHDEKGLDAYCEFRGRLSSLPEEIYLIPIGFKGYLRKFIKIASKGAEMTGDKIFNSWLKETEEDVYTRLRKGLISPLVLKGVERKQAEES
ncbi:MAG: hypothetical protein DRJ62_07925 [Thermoprotei archaeon]|nr:MAG: hypothetical protein DRJ62_07925 [Thermoprotei archaeon]